jgi:hypothetical protein
MARSHKGAELGVVQVPVLAEFDAGGVAARGRDHVRHVRGRRHGLVAGRDPQLRQSQLLGCSGVRRAPAGSQGTLQLARLHVPEQLWPRYPEAVQVRLHDLGAGLRVRRQVDPQGHEVGVGIGVGLDGAMAIKAEQAETLQRRDRAGDGLDSAVAGGLARSLE